MTSYEIYTLIFSCIVAVSTIVYSYLTWKIVKETKLTREHQNKPDINIYLKRSEADASFVFLIIENCGLGHAQNVIFRIIKNFKFSGNREIDLNNIGPIANGKENFYPKQKLEYFLTDLSQNYSEKVKENFEVQIEYENIYSRKYVKTINLNFTEIIGQSVLTPPPNYIGRISYELNEIRKILKNSEINKDMG